jgi:hypothetical protein
MIGGTVEACLVTFKGGAGRVAAFAYAFGVMFLGLIFKFFLADRVGDEPWRLFDPVIPTSIMAFGAAGIRIRAISLVEDLTRWRASPRERSRGPGLLLSVPMLVLACVLMGWLIKVIYWDLLLPQPYRPGA